MGRQGFHQQGFHQHAQQQPLPQVPAQQVYIDPRVNQSIIPMDVSFAPAPAPLVKPVVFTQYRNQQANQSMESVHGSPLRNTSVTMGSPYVSPSKSAMRITEHRVVADHTTSSPRDVSYRSPVQMQTNQDMTQQFLTPAMETSHQWPTNKQGYGLSDTTDYYQSFSGSAQQTRSLNSSIQMDLHNQSQSNNDLQDPNRTMEMDLSILNRTPAKQTQQATILEDFSMRERSPRTPRDEFLQETFISPSLLPAPPPEKWPQTKAVKRSDPPSPDIPSMSARRDDHLTLTPKRTRQHDVTQVFDGTTFLDTSNTTQYAADVPFSALNLETQYQYPGQAPVDPPIYRALSEGHRPSQPFNADLYRQPKTSTPQRHQGNVMLPMVTPIVQANQSAHNMPTPAMPQQAAPQGQTKSKKSKKQKPQPEPYSRPVRDKKPIDRYGYN
jgi:hypothetical protein